jgi:hypothetical protein
MKSSWYTVVGRMPGNGNETHWFLAECYDDALRQFSGAMYLDACGSCVDACEAQELAVSEGGTQYGCYIESVVITETEPRAA